VTGGLKLGVVNLLRSSREAVQVAEAVEAAGFWGLGLSDTAPKLYQDCYATAGACLAATDRLHVGPTVTNTVARHWSVLAATARSFDELAPGRFFAGVATGDGAVHSVGLRPSTWSQLEADLLAMQPFAPDALEIHLAASGPKGAVVAGRVATDFMIGTGLEPAALKALATRAREARQAAGIASRLRTWVFLNCYVVPDAASVPAARAELAGRANALARFAFEATFEDKAVPEHWQPIVRERLAAYDFAHHIKGGAANPNSHLFDDIPEIQEYLLDRMLLVGTRDQCYERLERVAREAELDGVWLALTPMALENDAVAMVRAAADAFAPLVASNRM
jgi:alkanesulfonate monooxygenase SsuD/methylene tetrahydromethanopterin reductase-like flavin-dependent oxidoreductase (luciferase family)